MRFHRYAKLGLAGRLALVRAIEAEREGGRGRVQRLASDGAPLVASVAGGERAGACDARLLGRPLEQAAPESARARARSAGADLHLPPANGLGAAARRCCDRLRPLHSLERAQAGWHLSARARGAATVEALPLVRPVRDRGERDRRIPRPPVIPLTARTPSASA